MRKVVDEKEARACMLAVARSGEPLAAWARRHGIDGRSLHAWLMNLARVEPVRESTTPVRAKLVELVPSSMAVSARRYVVRIGEASVDVGDDFDAGTLRRILEVLRAC